MIKVFFSIFLFLATIQSVQANVTVPPGVVYKTASKELNAKAEEFLRKEFGSKSQSSTTLFQKIFICGPYLWNIIKDDPDTQKLSKSYNPFSMPIYESNKVVGVHFMLGRIAREEFDPPIFRKLIHKSMPLKKGFTIRSLNPEELKRYWAMISWDIEEPIFILEDGTKRILVHLVVNKKEELQLFWIDDFSEASLKKKIGEIYKTTDFKSAMLDFLKKNNISK